MHSRRTSRLPRTARLTVSNVRRRIADACERGLTETVVSGTEATRELAAIGRMLRREGFKLTAVYGEDGPYSVVYW